MTCRHSLNRPLGGLAVSLLHAAPKLNTIAHDRPNIVIFMLEDVGFSNTGSCGSEIRPPANAGTSALSALKGTEDGALGIDYLALSAGCSSIQVHRDCIEFYSGVRGKGRFETREDRFAHPEAGAILPAYAMLTSAKSQRRKLQYLELRGICAITGNEWPEEPAHNGPGVASQPISTHRWRIDNV